MGGRANLETGGIVDGDFRQLAEQVVAAMGRLGIPGAAVGTLRDGEERYAGFGITNAEAPVPVDPRTLFQIGSITKTMTGTIAMRLVEQEKLALDVPVRTYLPDLALRDEAAAANVTLRHLLSHTGGWLGDYFDDTGRGDDALATIVGRMADLPQWTPLGETFSYNNAGFYLAGRIIEVVTGKPYEAVAREMLLDPLGMDEAFFAAEDCISRRVAVGHNAGEGGATVARPWALARAANPVGGLSASVRAMLKYARFHLGDGRAPDGTALLRPQSLAAMQTPAIPAGSGAGAVGLTWMIKALDGIKTVRHSGGTNGQISLFLLVPEKRFALVILTNADRGGELTPAIAAWALRHYCGIAEAEFAPRELAASGLDEYVGTYRGALSDVEISVRDGKLILQSRPRGGFPERDTPPGKTPPPTGLDLGPDDTLIALDAPFTGTRGEFLRGPDGAIAWVRFGSRIARRETGS